MPVWGCPVLTQLVEALCATDKAAFRGRCLLPLGVDLWGITAFYTSLGQRETVSPSPRSRRAPLPSYKGFAHHSGISRRCSCYSTKLKMGVGWKEEAPKTKKEIKTHTKFCLALWEKFLLQIYSLWLRSFELHTKNPQGIVFVLLRLWWQSREVLNVKSDIFL